MNFGRALLADFQAYTPGEQLNRPGIIKLNTNELPYPPSPRVAEALQQFDVDALRRYPDPGAVALREAWARRFGYEDAAWALAGNGMDEMLGLAVRALCDPGDRAVATYPTYSMYETLCALHGCALDYVDLAEDFGMPEALYQARGRLLFLTRPNAPSGIVCQREEAERLVQSFPGVVVIDEAYADFAEDDCTDLPRRYDNVLVTRTFSKSFGLAGLRLGMALGAPALLAELQKVRDPYNIDALAQCLGHAAICDRAYFDECVARVKATRAALTRGLEALGFQVYPSQTNFLLARPAAGSAARTIYQRLRERGILVRHFNMRRVDDCLRISVGTDEEVATLLRALGEIIGGREG